MNFKEEIELQLKDNKMLSYEIITQLKNKEYSSGKPKEIGDTVLFGMVNEEVSDGNFELKMITFHEEELGVLYEEDSSFYGTMKTHKLPMIKKIENGD